MDLRELEKKLKEAPMADLEYGIKSFEDLIKLLPEQVVQEMGLRTLLGLMTIIRNERK